MSAPNKAGYNNPDSQGEGDVQLFDTTYFVENRHKSPTKDGLDELPYM